MKRVPVLIIILVILLASSHAWAARGTGALQVSATVISACRGFSTTDIDFTNSGEPGIAFQTVGIVSDDGLRCTRNTSFQTYISRTKTNAGTSDNPGLELQGGTNTAEGLQGQQLGNHRELITFTIEY